MNLEVKHHGSSTNQNLRTNYPIRRTEICFQSIFLKIEHFPSRFRNETESVEMEFSNFFTQSLFNHDSRRFRSEFCQLRKFVRILQTSTLTLTCLPIFFQQTKPELIIIAQVHTKTRPPTPTWTRFVPSATQKVANAANFVKLNISKAFSTVKHTVSTLKSRASTPSPYSITIQEALARKSVKVGSPTGFRRNLPLQ